MLSGNTRDMTTSKDSNMQSAIVKRSIVIVGHKTSVSLEDAFWLSLKQIGKVQNMTLSTLVANIDTHRQHGNLSSAIRLFVLDHFCARTVLDSIDQPNRSAAPDPIATNGSYKVAVNPG